MYPIDIVYFCVYAFFAFLRNHFSVKYNLDAASAAFGHIFWFTHYPQRKIIPTKGIKNFARDPKKMRIFLFFQFKIFFRKMFLGTRRIEVWNSATKFRPKVKKVSVNILRYWEKLSFFEKKLFFIRRFLQTSEVRFSQQRQKFLDKNTEILCSMFEYDWKFFLFQKQNFFSENNPMVKWDAVSKTQFKKIGSKGRKFLAQCLKSL